MIRTKNKKVSALALGALMTIAMATAALTAPTNKGELLKDERHRLKLANTQSEAEPRAMRLRNMRVLGHNAIGGRGFNADVWVHEGFAYVGHWGFTDWASGSKQRFCPSGARAGIAVLDTRDPRRPRVVSKLQNPAGTSAEDVVVYTARYGPFAGRDIAVSGIQVCGGSRQDESFARGLMLWDVTNPTSPQELGFVNTGCCTRGVHEVEVEDRDDLGRTFAYASVPASGYPEADSPSGVRDRQGRGDFRLIDITNPAAPFEASDWGVISDLGAPPGEGLGCDADPNYGHSAEPSEDGRLAFVAYWDSGYIALDLTDPENPVYRGRTVYPDNADGDAHSSAYDDERRVLFAADEDFCKNSGPHTERGWGYLRVYDYSNLAAPEEIGRYRTPNSLGVRAPGAGDYTIHNPILFGETLYVSWYSDGVRVLDVSDPARPEEVAFFVPPAAQNPVKPSQRGVLSQTPQVWGVAYDPARDLVFASDMNSGLWIVEQT